MTQNIVFLFSFLNSEIIYVEIQIHNWVEIAMVPCDAPKQQKQH